MRFCTPYEQNLMNVLNKSYVERNEIHSYAHYTPSVRLTLPRQLFSYAYIPWLVYKGGHLAKDLQIYYISQSTDE
jgi:hypothetical protein